MATGIYSVGYADKMFVLVTSKGGKAVNKGDKLGDGTTLEGGRAPHHPGSTGRVWVKSSADQWEREFFPSVYDLVWREVTEDIMFAD